MHDYRKYVLLINTDVFGFPKFSSNSIAKHPFNSVKQAI